VPPGDSPGGRETTQPGFEIEKAEARSFDSNIFCRSARRVTGRGGRVARPAHAKLMPWLLSLHPRILAKTHPRILAEIFLRWQDIRFK
jgi:hypothetical protein